MAMDHQFENIEDQPKRAALSKQELSPKLRIKLIEAGIAVTVLDALALAMLNSDVNIHAWTYTHGMEAAFDGYGIEGVQMQVMYLIGNLGKWTGGEAKQTKYTLKRWSNCKKKDR